jgi:hypothetical protein
MNHNMELYLPGDVMSLIVIYLDERDYARLAQVNKAWNQWAYRNRIWGLHRWKPKTGAVGALVLQVPIRGFHVGSTHKTCFFQWLMNERIMLCKPIQTYYLDWKKMGSPCKYIEHHRFEDTFVAPGIYTSLDKEEQDYMFHRYADYAIANTTDRYIQYLQLILREFQQIDVSLDHIREPFPLGFELGYTSSEIMKELHRASNKIVKQSKEEAIHFVDHYKSVLRSSIAALRARGQSVWDANEAAFQKDPYKVWDSIAFSWISIGMIVED